MNTFNLLLCPPCQAAAAAAEQVVMGVGVLILAGIFIFLLIKGLCLVCLVGSVSAAPPAAREQPVEPPNPRAVDHSKFWANKLPPIPGENGQVFRGSDQAFNPAR